MRIRLTLLFLLVGNFLFSQDFPRSAIDLNRIADELYGGQDPDINYEELYENLVQLLSSPLDLNRASAAEFQLLQILSDEQIKSIVEYRKDNPFLSVYELQAVPLLDMQAINHLAPFVNVTDPTANIDASLWRRMREESDNYFILRTERTLELREGYKGDSVKKYAGSPEKMYLRFRSSRPGDFSIGFTAEKDPGEKIKWSPASQQYGFDYFSFHIHLQNKGRIKNLVIGDFQTQFGQGLMFGGIFGMGKGGETITTIRRTSIGLLPYTSVYESGGLRGGGATIRLTDKFFLTSFYSKNHRDASITTDTLDENSASSLQRSGLHRNDTELASRRKIIDSNWGIVLQYKTTRLEVGAALNGISFNVPITPTRNVYNQFVFSGSRNVNAGIFINYGIRNFSFFAEAASSFGAGAALETGVLMSVFPKLDLSLSYRNLGRNFYTFYTNAFAESSNAQNERGVYWGWKYTISHRVTCSGYMDFFQFPWLKFRTYRPSTGHEWLLRLTYQPSRTVMFTAQAREEQKARNNGENKTPLYNVIDGIKRNIFISIDYGLRQKLRMKSRAQFSTYEFNDHLTKGFVLLQDISADIGKFQLTGRYAIFDTDDYDNRQYVYENDVLLAYSMPAYYGTGTRKMIMIEYKLNRHVSFWLRFASTRYPGVEKIGTGGDSLDGNIRNDVKFQARIIF